MKVVIAEVEDWEIGRLKEFGDNSIIIKEKIDGSNANKYSDCEILCVFIHSKLDSSVLSKMKNLKYIVTRSTGFDHIDLKYCRKNKIKVLNVPEYGTHTVAEHTFALILALTRKIPESIERAREDQWSVQGLMGDDLYGKTLGIIGLGKIGQDVARKARAFGMEIISYTKHKNMKIAKSLGVKYESLDNLIKKSDVITIHTPLTRQTRHLINKRRVGMMKKGVYLINTARGEIIETSAIIDGIDSGIIKGAALDVLEGEGDIIEEHDIIKNKMSDKETKVLLRNHMLMKNHNVLLTPHVAFYTKEALDRILTTSCKNITSCMKNKPINLVR